MSCYRGDLAIDELHGWECWYLYCTKVLCCTGVEPVQVQETVENHLKSLLIKHFDPRKADSIFTEEGEVTVITICVCLRPSEMLP